MSEHSRAPGRTAAFRPRLGEVGRLCGAAHGDARSARRARSVRHPSRPAPHSGALACCFTRGSRWQWIGASWLALSCSMPSAPGSHARQH
eukprot:15439761-Alexandrium_andersonii.AAC.1